MATQKSIAIRQAEALERMSKAAGRMARRLGVKAPDTDVTHREPGIAEALRMDELAAFVERADKAVREQMAALEDEIGTLKQAAKAEKQDAGKGESK